MLAGLPEDIQHGSPPDVADAAALTDTIARVTRLATNPLDVADEGAHRNVLGDTGTTVNDSLDCLP